MTKNVDLPAIFLCLKEERKKEEARERRKKEACYVARSPFGYFPTSCQVDVTLSKNN